jgi:lysophospholipase L1-like esterase
MPAERSRLRAATARLAMLAVSIALGLVVVEIGLRLAGYSPAYVNAMGSFHESNPVTGHRGKPGFRGRFKTPEFDVLIVHDDAGFRRQEFQKPESAGTRHLAVFGDSFVWGWGVEQGEVFTDQLSRRVPDWRVENYGINGTGTLAQYELFAAERRDRLQPGDVVLLAFYGNDLADNVEGTRTAKMIDGKIVPQPVKEPIQGGWRRTLQESSYLFNYLSYVANRYQLERRIRRAEARAIAAAEAAKAATAKAAEDARRARPAANLGEGAIASSAADEQNSSVAAAETLKETPQPTSAPVTDDAAVQIAIVRHYLLRWHQDCAQRKARFIVAYVPGVGELNEGRDEASDRREAAFRQAFNACTKDTDIEVLDLLPGMLDAKRSGKVDHVIIAGDGHWNPAGHRLVAEIVAARLADATTARRPGSDRLD